MVYVNGRASIPVHVTPGAIPLPGSVDFQLQLLTPAAAPFLPLLNGSYCGSLAWDAADGTQAAIAVPIDWSQVRLNAVTPEGAAMG